MNRGYESQNRSSYRGGYNHQNGPYRHSAHPYHSPRASGPNHSINVPFDAHHPVHQQHMHGQQHQRLPSLMSAPISAPFPPPHNMPPHPMHHPHQQNNLQQLIVRQQQQLPLTMPEKMILNQYYNLLATGPGTATQNYQQPMNNRRSQPHPPWPVSQIQPPASPAPINFSSGFEPQRFNVPPPLPPLPPQQPPPPEPCDDPPPPPEPTPVVASPPPPMAEQPVADDTNNDTIDANQSSNNTNNNASANNTPNERTPRNRRRNRNRKHKTDNSNSPNQSNGSSSSPAQSDLFDPSKEKSLMDFLIEDDDTQGTMTSILQRMCTSDSNESLGSITYNKRTKLISTSNEVIIKEWNAEHATMALAMEKECGANIKPSLILKFPDPDLSHDMVYGFSSLIDHVHFQQPSTPRYCSIKLKDGADVDKVKEELSQIDFGNGKIKVEYKNITAIKNENSIQDIDPYTLFVGNLPTSLSVKRFKAYFVNAGRIDLGFAQRMRQTRYAFIRYRTIEHALIGYKMALKMSSGGRSTVIRFRRLCGNIGMNTGESDGKKKASKRKRKAMQDGEEASKDEGDAVMFCDAPHRTRDAAEEATIVAEQDALALPIESAASAVTVDQPTMSPRNAVTIESIDDNQNSVEIDPIGMVVMPIKVKLEAAGDDTTGESSSILETSSLPTSINTEIKQECDDDFSDDEYFDDLPVGDDETVSEFGDDEFMRQNNLVADDEVVAPYWERELVSLCEIKTEDECEKERKVFERGPSRRPSKTATISAASALHENLDALFDQLNPDDMDT